MLGGESLRRSAAVAARQRVMFPLRSQRSLSSFATRTAQSPSRAGSISSLSSFRRPFPQSASRLASTRFNSTAAATASSAASDARTTATSTTPGATADPSAVPGIPELDISQIPEKIGYLKELGLDYGWGPSSMVQFLLENIHMYTGIPWWGSVVATAALIRIALFHSTLQASDTTIKLNQVKPLLQPVRERMVELSRNQDTVGALQERQKMKMINEEYGIKAWKAFVPMLQIPIGFGCFRVMRGMSSLPVPALENESVLWLSDLTLRDPTFLLPIATGAMMYYSLRRGGDTGTSPILSTPFGQTMLYVLPGISILATAFWPSMLQLYFFVSALLGALQNRFMTSPGFREFAGLSPLPTNTPGPTGGVQDLSPQARLRMMADQAAAEKAAAEGKTPEPRVSFIDRAVDNLKSSTKELKKEAQSQMDKFAGTSSTTADGAPKPKPKRTQKQIDAANEYEMRRREEMEWLRNERNMQRREQHQKRPSKTKER